MAFRPRSEATEHTVADGETLESIASGAGLTAADLTLFNYGTSELKEVNRALFEIVGCRTKSADGTSYVFSSADGTRGTGKILIPKKFKASGLSPGKTYVTKLKALPPMCAVHITQLDKWFLPGEASDGGELCAIGYELEGDAKVADQVSFDVYGSGYCTTALDANGDVDFSDVDATTPIFAQALDKAKAAPRSAHSVDDWRGQSNAPKGMLKPRAGLTRHINVAFSPYTVVIRFYRKDADKKARIRIEDFWPRWDSSGTLVADSLKIRWHVEECNRLEHGQLLIVDKTDKVVFRDALKREHLSSGAHDYTWNGKLDDGSTLKPEQMPYRVQIQGHSKVGETEGVAVAAMHTEVRLFVDPLTGAHPEKPHTDPNSLTLALAPWVAEVPTKDAETDKWYQYQLALAGFHPGPVDGNLARDDAKKAIAEFQRSYPSKKADNSFERVAPSGTKDAKTTDLLAALPANTRSMFGNPTNRTDIADPAAINGSITNPADATGLIVWVDDRHYYTEPASAGLPAHIDLGNYRPGMSQGDGRTTLDANCMPRPWIPLQVDLPVLTKDTASAGVASTAKAISAASRKALGPLRIDWVFEEEPKDLSVFDLTNTNYDKDFVRSKKWTENVIDGKKATQGARTFENCPEDLGGIRPTSLDAYYKAIVGHGNDSLKPWIAHDDTAVKIIGTVLHDDYGQDLAKVYADHRGRAGAFFRPSRIAGDGYRFGARLGFEPLPGAPSQFDNWKVLGRRYTKLPQGYSCPLRIWRKTSYRAHLSWCTAGSSNWSGVRDPAADLYRPAFLHFIDESSQKTGAFVQTTASNLVGAADYRSIIVTTVSPPYRTLNIALDSQHVWPFLSEKRWGVPVSAPDVRLPAFYEKVLDPMFNHTWRKFREKMIWTVLSKVEQQHGLLKGHLLVEFTDSPSGTVYEYQCKRCNKYFVEVVERLPDAERMNKKPCPACNGSGKGSGLKKTGEDNYTLMLPAVGVGMGATWLFTGGGGPLWAHEMGHHRHLEHAQARPGHPNVAPGAKNQQHDSVPNTHKYGATAAGKDKCWDRQCVMSYAHGKQYFCGKCVLKNRGWKVEGLTNPASGIHD